MAAYYLDSSALVKRYLAETGWAWVQTLCDPANGNEICLARITLVEVVSAVSRRRDGGSISTGQATTVLDRFRQDWHTDFAIVEMTPALLENAASVADTYLLRAYDAVQLAAAIQIHALRDLGALSALTLVSADLELNAAAGDVGIPVDDPNAHT